VLLLFVTPSLLYSPYRILHSDEGLDCYSPGAVRDAAGVQATRPLSFARDEPGVSSDCLESSPGSSCCVVSPPFAFNSRCCSTTGCVRVPLKIRRHRCLSVKQVYRCCLCCSCSCGHMCRAATNQPQSRLDTAMKNRSNIKRSGCPSELCSGRKGVNGAPWLCFNLRRGSFSSSVPSKKVTQAGDLKVAIQKLAHALVQVKR